MAIVTLEKKTLDRLGMQAGTVRLEKRGDETVETCEVRILDFSLHQAEQSRQPGESLDAVIIRWLDSRNPRKLTYQEAAANGVLADFERREKEFLSAKP